MIRAAVLGADVSKSRSPAIHNAAFRALGIEGEYVALSAWTARRFRALVAKLRADGYRYLNVTIPHKLAAARLAQRRGPEVRVSAAANTLLFQRGGVRAENTDGAGLIAALGDLGVSPAGAVIVMAGAGGAAAGALEALTRAGASIRVLARRPAVARTLRARLPANRRAQGHDRHLEPRRADRRAGGRLGADLGGARRRLGGRAPRAGVDACAATPPCWRWPTARRRRSRTPSAPTTTAMPTAWACSCTRPRAPSSWR